MYEAYWLTDFPRQRVSSRALLRMAKSRWEIENQGFDDAKNHYGFEVAAATHHERPSLLVVWLLTCLALTVERLYRVRYLHRGRRPVRAAIHLLLLLQLSLGRPVPAVTDSTWDLPFRAPWLSTFQFSSWHSGLSLTVRQIAKKRGWKLGAALP